MVSKNIISYFLNNYLNYFNLKIIKQLLNPLKLQHYYNIIILNLIIYQHQNYFNKIFKVNLNHNIFKIDF